VKRANGEGSIDRHHKPGCARPVDKRGEATCGCGYRARGMVTVNGERVRRVVYGKTHAETVDKWRRLTAADVTGTLTPTGVGTVKEWLDEWFESNEAGWKVNTRKSHRSKIDRYLVPHLGAYRLDRLAPEHLDRMYRAMRNDGLAEGTCRQAHMVLRCALAHALAYRKVSVNVACMVVKPPATTQAQRAVMGTDDARKVLAAAGDNPRFWLALLCGLRQGEALALRWDCVDLEGGGIGPYLVVRYSLCREPGVGLVFTTPKSQASAGRLVPLRPEVVARLKVHRAREIAKGRGADGDLVFPNSLGRPLEPRRDHDHWVALLTAAGVEGHYTLHSARNTCAHLLEDAGAPARVVAEILGHSQVAMTYRYQANNVPAMREAVGRLDAVLA